MPDKLLKSEVTPEGYEIRTTLCDGKEYGCEDFEIVQAYNENGEYVGDPETAKSLYERGIKPELSREQRKTCSIGFCEKEQKWYGWSHRAICGFRVGDKVVKGDCAYKPADAAAFIENCQNFWTSEDHEWTKSEKHDDQGRVGVLTSWEYKNTIPNKSLHGTIGSIFTEFPQVFGRGEWTAETLEDAKQMAIDFAEGVG